MILTKRKSESVLLWDKRKLGEPNDGREEEATEQQTNEKKKIVVKATHVKKRVHVHTYTQTQKETQMY